MRIALDVDGVLADVIHAWLSYNNKIRTTILKSDISEWDFWKRYNINKFDFYEELSTCWKSWKFIPPTENNISSASKEISKVGTVDIVTAREDSTHNDVKNWLKMHDVTFKNYVGVLEGTEKAKLDYDVFIDDSPLNAESMLALGKSVILYSQPWNLDFPDPRAKRISELKNAVPIISQISRHDQ
ncbi:MAG: 5' nucleotidase, NT5C type [Nitrosotalea sp.]